MTLTHHTYYMVMSQGFWVAVVIGLLAFLVRLPGLGSLMTADEENWMLRSAGFYRNLFLNHDPGGTFMTTHPGATTMWLAGAGIMWQEARLGFASDTSNIIQFRRAALFPMVLVISLLFGIATWQLVCLFGMPAGIIAGVVLALEPYLVGLSQIVHLDLLLALLMLNSVLAFLRANPLASGIFAGLAVATKLLPSLWLFIFFAIFLVWRYRLRLGVTVRRLGFIFGVAMLTFWLIWPALWFTADLGRSFEKDIPSVVQDAHVAIEYSSEQIAPASFYVRSVLGRTSPFVMILVIASVFAMIQKQRGSLVFWLLIYAVGFLVLTTFAAKKADRYTLPALVMLPIIAGWALGKIPTLHSRSVKWGMALVAGLLLAQVLLLSPHAIAYNNPLFDIRPLSQQGWGEGLEEAAAWLNQHPLAEELYVASWYPGVMRTFFRGKTLSLSSRGDARVGFVVLYRNMRGREPGDIATEVWQEFQNEKVAHVVEIQGAPYVWIYDMRGLHYFPNHIGELYGSLTVGQLVPVVTNGWRAIEIGLATFSSRVNTQDVTLHVRESVDAKEDVRTVRVNAGEIQDSSYHRFEFEPITDTAGKTYYVFLESLTSRPGDAVTVRFANQDLLPGEMVKNGKVLPGRDVAWRISK